MDSDINPPTVLPVALRRLLRAALQAPLQQRGIPLAQFRDYANGDQWGGGRYWTGRKPKDGGMEAVRKLFVQDDQIGACLDRLVSSVLRYEPEWLLRSAHDDAVTLPEHQPLHHALAHWLAEQGVHDTFTSALRIACWAGRSALRVYIPEHFAARAYQGAVSLEQAFAMLRVQALDPMTARALRDSHGMIVGYWYAYETDTNDEAGARQAMLELHTPSWVYYCRRDSLEVVRVRPNPLYEGSEFAAPRFQLTEMGRQRLVPVFGAGTIDKQNALNRELTHMNRNGELAGYRTLVVKNARLPADDSPHHEVGLAADGYPLRVTRDAPPPWAFGADTVLHLVSIVLEDGQASTVLPVDVDTVEPVRADLFFEPTIAMYRQSILDDFSQGFVQGVQKAVSGESKRESRDAFNKLVELEARMVERAMRGVLETAVRLALVLADVQLSTPWQIVTNVKTDIARSTLDTYEVMMRGYEAGTNSLLSAVTSNPVVDDVEAELERIREQSQAQEIREQRLQDAQLEALLR